MHETQKQRLLNFKYQKSNFRVIPESTLNGLVSLTFSMQVSIRAINQTGFKIEILENFAESGTLHVSRYFSHY